MILSLDSETDGLDFWHGARPFFVTTCTDEMEQRYWEWDVDPLTRQVQVVEEEVAAIKQLILSADTLVLQNSKFDIHALRFLGITVWPWDNLHDTLLAGHVLASNQPHDLTSMALHYLKVNIQPYEEALQRATLRARTIARSRYKDWRIAKPGLPEMPSAKGKTWSYDTWLPRAIAQAAEYAQPEAECEHRWNGWICDHCQGHRWWVVLSDYGNADSAVTVKLWQVLRDKLLQRGYYAHYLEQRKLIKVLGEMEQVGVTVSKEGLATLKREFGEASLASGRVMVNLAAGYPIGNEGSTKPYPLELPKNGVNGSLRDFCFGKRWLECNQCGYVPKSSKDKAEAAEGGTCSKCLKKKTKVNALHVKQALLGSLVAHSFGGLNLPPVRNAKAKTDAPTLDAKNAIPFYLETLPPKSKPLRFVEHLVSKRAYDTALAYMEAYEKFWVPKEGLEGYNLLHPSINITGTDTLRFSCENPNTQQISKKKKINLRKCFGPGPGREWWSLDAKNIELRLPAFLCGEEELIALFEKPDEPPYYGSEHLLNFATVYPDLWEKELGSLCKDPNCCNSRIVNLSLIGPHCKYKYKDTNYQWGKNGGFAVGYGAMERLGGTADRAFHRDGAHSLLKRRFAKKEKLNQQCIDFANRHGYIETIPDRTVDSKHGYPLLCSRSDYGKALPTIPLNYKIQGSACWVLRRGMVLVAEYLEQLNRQGKDSHYLIMNVHDEIVLDFPYHPNKGNLPKIRKVRRLLESVGQDLVPAIPLPFGVEYHTKNWAEGEVIAC